MTDGDRQLRPKRSLAYLRNYAMIVYTTHPAGVSVEKMTELPDFIDVPLTMLQTWCNEDGWTKHREQVYTSWREMVEKRLGNELADAWAQEFRDLEEIRQKYTDELIAGAFEVKSAEGILKAILDVSQRMDQLRNRLKNEFQPGSKADEQLQNDLTPDELDAAIEAINRVRSDAANQPESAAPDPGETVGSPT